MSDAAREAFGCAVLALVVVLIGALGVVLFAALGVGVPG